MNGRTARGMRRHRLMGVAEVDDTRGKRTQPRFERGVSRFKPEQPALQRVKAAAHAWLARHPGLRTTVVPLYREVQHERGRLARMVARVPRDPLLEPDRILWVSPAAIRYKTLAPGSAFRNLGCGWVLDGDWDVFEHPFVNDMRYKSMREVIDGGRPWSETEEYASALEYIAAGVPFQRCRTRAELDRHFAAMDTVIHSLRTEGYLTQAELRRQAGGPAIGRDDEITIAIGRDGDLFFRDGAHRLAMVKLLHIERIPVRVTFRHPVWMELRRLVCEAIADGGGLAPQPMLHPDFDNVRSRHACQARWRALERAVAPAASVLVIQPGWGHFCERLHEEGRECAAVALPAGERPILERLGRAGRDYDCVPAEAASLLDAAGKPFDIGLLLDDGLRGRRRSPLSAVLPVVTAAGLRVLLVEPAAFAGGPGSSDVGGVLDALCAAGGFARVEEVAAESEAGPLFRLS